MIIQFPEQKINGFLVPAFTLSKGEIVIIHFGGGAHFYETTMALAEILTGKNNRNNTVVNKEVKFVEHIKSNGLLHSLFPLKVGKYLRKNANSVNEIYKKIYRIDWIKPTTEINALSGTLRKFLSLYTTLSWTNRIILDLVGVDPLGGQDVFKILKKLASNGGAVILIDNSDEFKNDCTLFLRPKYLETA